MAQDFSRVDRVAGAIQRAVAAIIQVEIQQPECGLMTISNVTLSKDLAHAKVFVSVLPDECTERALTVLNDMMGVIRGLLSKRVKLRITPTLRFMPDETLRRADALSKLIDEVCTRDRATRNDGAPA